MSRITERLLSECKESNQTNKQSVDFYQHDSCLAVDVAREIQYQHIYLY